MSMISQPVPHHNRRNKGFTLLEVMVALVIFSIGLLGLAGLEAQGMRYNHSAYLKTQATFLAYDILDRMRANREAAANNQYNATFTSPGTPNGCNTDGTATNCTTIEMAQHDIFEWKTNLGVLPNGQGSVDKNTNVYVVSVRWDDPGVPNGYTIISIRSEL